jgi:hypothetical protein
VPVPTSIDDLSTTEGSNSPSGSDQRSQADNYLRALSAIVRQVYEDGSAFDPTDTYSGDTVTNALMAGQVNVLWFMSDAQRADYISGGLSNDFTTLFQSILDDFEQVHFPKGTAKCGSLTTGAAKLITGAGGLCSILRNVSGSNPVLTTESDLVVIRDLGFEGNGGLTDSGLVIQHNVIRVEGCYFNAFNKGVVQNDTVGEYVITGSNFALCNYGVHNHGNGINAKVEGCRALTCKTAVYISDVGEGATEGFKVSNCLFYDCGHSSGMAVIEVLSSDYTLLTDNMVDGNDYICVYLNDSERCEIRGGYYASNNGANTVSNIRADEDCSGLHIDTRTEFAPYYGVHLLGGASNYTSNATIKVRSANNNSGAAGGGDILCDSVTNILVHDSQLYTSGSVSIGATATNRASSVVVTGSRLVSDPTVASGSCTITGANNIGFVLDNAGIAVIDNSSTTETFAHGCKVLTGRQVIVTLGNAQDFKGLKWAVSGADVTVTNSSNVGDTTFAWVAKVI